VRGSAHPLLRSVCLSSPAVASVAMLRLARSASRPAVPRVAAAASAVAGVAAAPQAVAARTMMTVASARAARSSATRMQPRARASCASLLSGSTPSGALSFSSPADSLSSSRRCYSIENVRNIGISAHIDSGKTTLSERILFYTGRIHEIHEVKGKDNVGATMDSMELEREKGITIQSAATSCVWKQDNINLIDTPGHVDFTIEVERSLRVLDGAIMVLCGVAGVQSQSLTVDRQMRRYNVPRITFINKLDRQGSNPWKGIEDIRNVLRHNAAAIQIPLGLESEHQGVVDLVKQVAYYFEGPKGETVVEREVPEEYKGMVAEKRREMLERLAEVDDTIAELFIEEKDPSVEVLQAAIRRATIALKFVPVMMGSAYKNKGIQPLLDAVNLYLPHPADVSNHVLQRGERDPATGQYTETQMELPSDIKKPFVGLAFKLEERPFGQLTYMRIYQGKLTKGDYLWDTRLEKRVKIQRIVKMHANSMEDISEAHAGEIIALFGVDCSSGTTFVANESLKLSMTSMHVPEPVISLSIAPKNLQQGAAFSKALNRFQKEDPTFRVHVAAESQETIISGMGELHLEIYVERMKREYKVESIVGQPKVNYRETCSTKATFNYTHKKQTGGQGQYGKVVGYVEPLEEGATGYEYENRLVGNVIPPEFYPGIEKGFKDAVEKGLAGYPVQGVRIVLTDGGFHAIDSSEIAFRTAAVGAFREAFRAAKPLILEPVMAVEIEVPQEHQGGVVAMINRRRGMIENVEALSAGFTQIKADVPLSKMFGYSTDLRSSTEGKGEFSMEYKYHAPVDRQEQNAIMEEYERKRLEAMKNK